MPLAHAHSGAVYRCSRAETTGTCQVPTNRRQDRQSNHVDSRPATVAHSRPTEASTAGAVISGACSRLTSSMRSRMCRRSPQVLSLGTSRSSLILRSSSESPASPMICSYLRSFRLRRSRRLSTRRQSSQTPSAGSTPLAAVRMVIASFTPALCGAHPAAGKP